MIHYHRGITRALLSDSRRRQDLELIVVILLFHSGINLARILLSLFQVGNSFKAAKIHLLLYCKMIRCEEVNDGLGHRRDDVYFGHRHVTPRQGKVRSPRHMTPSSKLLAARGLKLQRAKDHSLEHLLMVLQNQSLAQVGKTSIVGFPQENQWIEVRQDLHVICHRLPWTDHEQPEEGGVRDQQLPREFRQRLKTTTFFRPRGRPKRQRHLD